MTSQYSLGVTGLAYHEICIELYTCSRQNHVTCSLLRTYAQCRLRLAGLLFRNYSRFSAMPIILKIIPE